MATNGETFYLWVDKGGGAELTSWQFKWGEYATLGHVIRCLRDELEREVVGKRKGERPFEPGMVPIGFGSSIKFERWFDGKELKTAEAARQKSLRVARNRNGIPAGLPG